MTTHAGPAGRAGNTPGRHGHRIDLLESAVTSNPAACRWCPHEKHDHMQRWTKTAGWHQWTQPTQEQIKARMLARRAAGGTR